MTDPAQPTDPAPETQASPHAPVPREPQEHEHRTLHAIVRGIRILFIWGLMGACVWLYLTRREAENAIRTASEDAQSRLRVAARTAVHDEMVSLLTMTAGMAGDLIRPPFMAGDLDQVRSIVRRIARHEHITGVSVMRNDGHMLISTDKSMEGQSMSGMFRDAVSQLGKIVVDEGPKGDMRAIIPISNSDTMLAAIIITYDASRLRSMLIAADSAMARDTARDSVK